MGTTPLAYNVPGHSQLMHVKCSGHSAAPESRGYVFSLLLGSPHTTCSTWHIEGPLQTLTCLETTAVNLSLESHAVSQSNVCVLYTSSMPGSGVEPDGNRARKTTGPQLGSSWGSQKLLSEVNDLVALPSQGGGG